MLYLELFFLTLGYKLNSQRYSFCLFHGVAVMSSWFYFKNKPSLLEIMEGNLLHDEFKVKGGLAFWPDVSEDQEYSTDFH